MKMPKILFFIAGMAPTVEEAETALDIGAVAMRNRSVIMPTDNPEAADAVAGEVIPEPYKDYPVVKSLADAIKIVRDKAKAEANFTAETLKANAAAAGADFLPANVGGNPNAADLTGNPGQGAPTGKETPERGGLGGTGKPAGEGQQPAGGGTTPITKQSPGTNAPGWKKNA